MGRDYRKEYDDYYGVVGRTNKLQDQHRLHKTARNKAHGEFLAKHGAAKMEGMDVDHKNHNPLDSRDCNLRLRSIHENRRDNDHKTAHTHARYAAKPGDRRSYCGISCERFHK